MDHTDEALQKLGKWGRWQLTLYSLLSIAAMWPASWHMLAIVFIGATPKHTCMVPKNHSYSKVSTCSVTTLVSDSDGQAANETIPCPNGYEYDGTIGVTITSQWNLVCERDFMADTTQTVLAVGVLIGALFFSSLSDRFGRKPILLFSEWGLVVVGVITAFCSNYYAFAVLRFFAGALQQGIILTGFVMACELFPAKMRTFAGLAIELFWAAGMFVLALLAYLIRHWSYLQLAITLPGLLTIPFFWILPESIPWLVANDRVPEAEAILQKAANCNGVTLAESSLSPLDTANDPILKDHEVEDGENKPRRKSLFDKLKPERKVENVHAAKYTLLDVFRSRTLMVYSLIMMMLWFVNSLVYFGLSLTTSTLAGDPYLNFFLSGLVEVPAYSSCIFLLNKFGRRRPLIVFHTIAGAALALTLLIPAGKVNGVNLAPLNLTLNLIGKFGITGSFGIVFLYAPEIFPTTLRSQAMGIASVGGRIGNMLAPFSRLMTKRYPWLPGILFGSLSVGVGLLALILPETLNRPLPQTVEDIENWKKKPTADYSKDIELKNDVKL